MGFMIASLLILVFIITLLFVPARVIFLLGENTAIQLQLLFFKFNIKFNSNKRMKRRPGLKISPRVIERFRIARITVAVHPEVLAGGAGILLSLINCINFVEDTNVKIIINNSCQFLKGIISIRLWDIIYINLLKKEWNE